MRFFNTAGPVNAADHYTIPPLERVDLAGMLQLIQQKKYFVLHAPRQTGKTSVLIALQDYLNAQGQYFCVYANLEVAQGYREQINSAIATILLEISIRAARLGDGAVEAIARETLAESTEAVSLSAFLARWSVASAKPLVLLLDEIDSVVGDSLLTVLRQLRSGHVDRPRAFPSSVILCGVRDIRDYRLRLDDGRAAIASGSAFNIVAESMRLGDFSQPEMEQLYQQHTAATGQRFEPDAVALAWELTQGQPWLVNALAYETCFRMPAGRDRTQPITAEMIVTAKEELILRRVVHLDQLIDKLREPRVRRVIEPMLVTSDEPTIFLPEDVQYVVDLGLIRRTIKGELSITNPIYQEVIPRELTFGAQMGINQQTAWYVRPDGRLDMHKLLSSFQQFFRENSEAWLERFEYREAGPQLLVQAFLQRIVNGGGSIGREYALGRRRTDLLVRWRYPGGEQRIVLELKLLDRALEQTIKDGLAQTWDYLDKCAAEEAHLLIFDRTQESSWSEKIFRRAESFHNTPIWVWGM